MNSFPTPQIYFFAANLVFILSALFSAFFRWIHTCPEFSKSKESLSIHYPARIPIIIIALLLTLDFPYLLNTFSSDALLYTRVYSIVSYPIFLVILIKRFFFYTRFSKRYLFGVLIVPLLYVLPLFIYALKGENNLMPYASYILYSALLLGLSYFFVEMRSLYKLYLNANAKNEEYFSNSNDFPTRLAKAIVIQTPIIVFLCIILPAIFSSGWIKLLRDIIIAGFNIWLIGTTLASKRPGLLIYNSESSCSCTADSLPDGSSEESQTSIEDGNAESCDENNSRSDLLQKVMQALITEQMYKDSSLTLDDLSHSVFSNRKYVSQAISCSQYQSFYKLVNGLRIAYAIELKKQNPAIKQEEIAEAVGFNSRYVLARWMKQWQKGELTSFDETILMQLRETMNSTRD